MTPAGQLFLGLTAIVTVLVAVLTFAVLKFFTAARDTRGRMKDGGMEVVISDSWKDKISAAAMSKYETQLAAIKAGTFEVTYDDKS